MINFIKDFLAMVFATVTWFLGFAIIFTIFFLFQAGPTKDEAMILVAFIVVFSLCVLISRHNKRISTAMEYPFILFP
jgi:hypothetical protein